MNYFKQKLKLYQKVTGYTIPQICADMRHVEPKELRFALETKKVINPELVVKFYKMLEEELKINSKLALYPELFLPFIPGAFAVVSHKGSWYVVKEGSVYERPKYKEELEVISGFLLPPFPNEVYEAALIQDYVFGWIRYEEYI